MPERIPLKEITTQPVTDQLARPLRELRVSVIDRCNFRCTYCMPPDSLQGRGVFLPLVKLLTDHEIVDLVRTFTRLGVHKVRITGGEPLVRPGLPALIEQLAAIDGLEDMALTTNGVLLPRLATDLARAGLGRLTISLDSLDPDVLREMSGGKGKLEDVLAGIDAAVAAGFEQLKINTVVQRGVNDHTILDLLEHFRGSGHTVRLIEFMDVGNSNHWELGQVVPSAEWVRRIDERWPIEPVERVRASETARRYRYRDGQGEVGLISSISEPFCGGCSRARLTADGMFYTCLFASKGTNLMPLLRQADQTGDLGERIRAVWEGRTDRYSEIRGEKTRDNDKVEMYRIGG
ncbi:GTP 3',8-cyclase MoaA [Elongatibacter sediminis]|uniref:GTP 3',8-cyclase n=1 Tax=Elongatibacter sediminis TaxID=3119006 RepID=A0AAW9RN58_9GAMM